MMRVVVFGAEEDRVKAEAIGAAFILRTGRNLSEDIRSSMPKGTAIGKMAVVIKGPADLAATGTGEVYRDLAANKKPGMEMPSYIMIDSGITAEKTENAKLNLANLVRSVIQKQPCVVAIGYTTADRNAFNGVKDLLRGIGMFAVIRNLSQALTDIIRAIRATAVSA